MLNNTQQWLLRYVHDQVQEQNEPTGEANIHWDRAAQALHTEGVTITGPEIQGAILGLASYGVLKVDATDLTFSTVRLTQSSASYLNPARRPNW